MQGGTRNWEPIIEKPAERELAQRIIDHITRFFMDLLASREVWEGTDRLGMFLRSTSVMQGLPGLALLYAYRFAEGGDPAEGDLAVDLLGRVVNSLADGASHASLSSGFVGCAWAVEHIDTLFSSSEVQEEDDLGIDPNEEIDRTLEVFLRELSYPFDAELLEGLSGIGVYFLERLPRPSALSSLRRIIDHLAEAAEMTPDGIAWRKPLDMMPGNSNSEFPEGQYNLGLSHGVPGVIAFLAQVCALDELHLRTSELLEGAVNFLLAQKAHVGDSVYSWATKPSQGPVRERCRVSWCYGDLGIATALMSAARLCQRADWREEALALAKDTTLRQADSAGVFDAMLCHGSAGNAHLFNRLYQATAEPSLRKAALYWYQSALDDYDSQQTASGFLFAIPEILERDTDTPKLVRAESYGFLEGVTGVALALLAGIGTVEPNWDRLLLASVPPLGFPPELAC